MIQIDKALLDDLFAKAKESERKRMNYDLRTSPDDNSQRMLNALLPGTEVPVHRHPNSNENVILLCGKLVEVIYNLSPGEGELVEQERIMLDPSTGNFGCVVPKGAWHTVEVLEPTVIFEVKDGKYGEDGNETYNGKLVTPTNAASSDSFHNYLGDLKKNIEYLMGKECAEGNTEPISSEYISRLLNVPLDEVEKCMKKMGV